MRWGRRRHNEIDVPQNLRAGDSKAPNVRRGGMIKGLERWDEITVLDVQRNVFLRSESANENKIEGIRGFR